ncbi:MAG: T9SS type A sorting domain-containing protein, partial [Bacteroidales bacterium]|nr:T9SS type A sorting domain-containing protein [Bacteroidales bacterium]
FSQDTRGNIEIYLNSIVDDIPGRNGNDFFIPTSSDLNNWNTMLTNILNNEIESANNLSSTYNYQITIFLDTTLSANNRFYILEEKKPQSKYWGTYVISIDPLREKLVIQAPHPIYDINTGLQAIYCFKRLIPRALFISGTHRCNHSQNSECSGSTSACGTLGPYKVSDNAHNTNSIFQESTQVLFDTYDNSVFVQLHGFGKRTNDPYLIMSNGTRVTPTVDYISLIEQELFKIDPTLTFKLAHINQDWSRLIAFTNTQGRFINNSTDACYQNATNSEGRFVHIEQEKSKLREDTEGWNKMYLALKNVFVSNTTGISPIKKQEQIKIYPNPFTNILNIKNHIPTDLRIYNSQGSLVFSKRIDLEERINLNFLKQGIYLFTISSKGKILHTEKIIKKI